MSTGVMEELQGAQEVPAVAGLCHRHTEEMETFLSSQIFGSCDSSNGVERVQGEEPLLSDVQECDAASGDGQGMPGSTQVSERVMGVCVCGGEFE